MDIFLFEIKCNSWEAYLFLPGLPQHCVCLNADALYSIHHHQRAIAQPCSGADLAAEVHMPRRVYEVDQVAWIHPKLTEGGAHDGHPSEQAWLAISLLPFLGVHQ